MKRFAFLLLFISTFIYAQEPKKEIYLTEIFKTAMSVSWEDSASIRYDGYKILVDDIPMIGYRENSIYHYSDIFIAVVIFPNGIEIPIHVHIYR